MQATLYPIENKGLFSNHFLEHQLKDGTEWKEHTNLEGIYSQILTLYESKKAMLSKANESQLRSEFLDCLVKSLGHHFAIEGAIKGTAKRPDYGLFSSVESANEAQINQVEGFYNNAIGICEAKQWDVKLDERDVRSGGIDRRTPNRQIDEYLHRSEVKWGILTNGRLWRIYYRENSYRNYYFQIDLAQTLESKDMKTFKYFVLFFRREAFLPDTNNRCFLDRVYQGSIDYSKEIGENIQENVYKAMKVLAEGFIDWKENKLSKSEETLRSVQDNTMILLYRLLFIYFAEANNLLDVRGATRASTNYRNNYSLDALKKNIRNKLENGENIPLYQAEYWGKLQTLFKFIDKGTEAMGIPKDELYIPSYNGGLFDTKKYSFLSRYKINDMSLSHAILLLSCPKGPLGLDRGFFDYSSLDIRHLGSIYEGLLEFRLMAAEEPMVAAKEKGKEMWAPEKDFRGKKYLDRIVEGDLYLATDKGERKATGSYYTPEYIVKYIVKNTVWPVAKRKRKEAEEENRKCSDAILSIKVLDPAMGSGHFLVEVVDFLAMVLGDAINRDIERGLMEEGEYSDDWLRREIVSHCIYGVDLNPMAVELAKVALWLKSISKDKPLSFLDHRLKCGNSLIGARLKDLPWYPQLKKKKKEIAGSQQRLDIPEGFVKKLVDTVNKMSEIRDDTLDDIKRKEEIFREFKETREYDMIKTLADVRTSVYFGNEVDEATYGRFSGDAFFNSEKQWTEQKRRWFVREGIRIGDEKRLFHWELEFPEIFFEEGKIKKNPGFDVVVGNPPYVRQEELGTVKEEYLKPNYRVYHGVADLYAYFFEASHILIRDEGRFGFISSNKFLRADYGKRLRQFLSKVSHIEEICDFGDLPVFEDATAYPVIIITEKKQKNTPTYYIKIPSLLFNNLRDIVKRHGYYIQYKHIGTTSWNLRNPQEQSIIECMEKIGVSLEKFVEGKVDRGIVTGADSVFVINRATKKRLIREDPKSIEIIKPIVKGEDVKRYEIDFKDRYLIFSYRGININNYPAIKTYLEGNKEQLLPRPKDYNEKENGKWMGRKPGSYKWYEIQDAITYWEEFENPKILYLKFQVKPAFYYDNSGLYSNSAVWMIPTNNHFIISILNSKIGWFLIRNYCTQIQNGYQLIWAYLKNIPIRRISFTTPADLRKELTDEAVSLYSDFLRSGDRGLLLAFVSERLSQEPEQSDVVHDLLAYLAERMIEMNKEKQEEIRGFLKWLEGEIGIKADDMTLKTKIKGYYKSDWDEFLKALKRNKKKITVMDITRRAPQEKIREEFDSSLGKLTPLLAKIEATDRLIDRVVYRLYGLTKEEIKVVEESFK